MKRLVIIGASGHGKVVADIAEKLGYQEILFLDDHSYGSTHAGYPVAGQVSCFREYSGYEFVVAIGNAAVRSRIQAQLMKEGLTMAVLVHPMATLAKGVSVGAGSVIMAGAVVNSDVVIGQGCIVNTCASVDHDCVVEDYAHVSVGAHLAGTVLLGRKSWVGVGATVSNNIRICEDCMIGAGAVVVKNIDAPGTYVGVPARLLSK